MGPLTAVVLMAAAVLLFWGNRKGFIPTRTLQALADVASVVALVAAAAVFVIPAPSPPASPPTDQGAPRADQTPDQNEDTTGVDIPTRATATASEELTRTPQRTQASLPTYTPYPTHTPYPTNTPYPTHTPYPTPAEPPTRAPLVVTSTHTPSPTAAPVTPLDGVLEVGEWWKTEQVWLRLREIVFSKYTEIRVEMDLWNRTNDNLIFQWSPQASFTLEDTTGHVYRLDQGYHGDSEVVQPGEVVHLKSAPRAHTARYPYDDHYFDPAVTDMYLTVLELSRISYARWHISVPK